VKHLDASLLYGRFLTLPHKHQAKLEKACHEQTL